MIVFSAFIQSDIGARAITLAFNWVPFQYSKINKYEDHFFLCSLCHTINLLLTKLVRSRWLDIGLVLFLRFYGPRRSLVNNICIRGNTWQYMAVYGNSWKYMVMYGNIWLNT